MAAPKVRALHTAQMKIDLEMNFATTRARLGILLATVFSAAQLQGAQPGPSVLDQIRTNLEQAQPRLTELRHDLHRHPEASGEERRTAEIVAAHLRAAGLEVRTNVGGHGVIGLLLGCKPGVVVAYRADMDALRSNEPDPAPFPSETPSVRHICGHDVHTTVAVGIAEALAPVRKHLPGTVKFIFQPAEETIQGARAMIQAGALETPKPAAIFALHTAPFPVGMISCPSGMALPGCDVAVIRLKGAGDLKAAANALSEKILSMNTVPAGGLASLATGKLPGPIKDFIYPQVDADGMRGGQWVTEISVRASSETNYAKAKRAIFETVRAARTGGVDLEMDYTDRRLADTINDPQLVQAATLALRRVLGEQSVLSLDGAVPYFGEDFAFFQKQIPGALFWLGVSNSERGIIGIPHLPNYQADDGAILVGALAMATVLTDYLEQNSGAAQQQAR